MRGPGWMARHFRLMIAFWTDGVGCRSCLVGHQQLRYTRAVELTLVRGIGETRLSCQILLPCSIDVCSSPLKQRSDDNFAPLTGSRSYGMVGTATQCVGLTLWLGQPRGADQARCPYRRRGETWIIQRHRSPKSMRC